MPASSPHRFRLSFAAKQPGKFAFPEARRCFHVADGLEFELVARNADKLQDATSFHIEASSFGSFEDAQSAAEDLRVKLRLLNAVLALGLNVPIDDSVTATTAPEVKEQVKRDLGVTVMDSIFGVRIFPDTGDHVEYIMSGTIVVRPSDPTYLLEAIRTLWSRPVQLDTASEDALNILCLATQEASDKAAFLANYLALEQLIERKPRSAAALRVLEDFQTQLAIIAADSASGLSEEEVKSLSGSLRHLNEESFPSALRRLAKQIVKPETICGLPVSTFFSACVKARNKIAHHAEPETQVPLADLSKALREFVLTLIWSRNGLTELSIKTSASTVSIPDGGMAIRAM